MSDLPHMTKDDYSPPSEKPRFEIVDSRSQPLKRADGFEPMKLIAVTERLRVWAESGIDIDSLSQMREDVKWLLNSHLDYYQRYEKWEKAYWYQQDKEDNGNIAISWRERAEQMEARFNWLLKRFEGVKWHDAGPLSDLKPEDEKYIDTYTLTDIIDECIKHDPRT